MQQDMKDLSDQLAQARRLCHRLSSASCVEEKRQGCHEILLGQRPHWSVLKREEQYCRIDQGETIPFDVAATSYSDLVTLERYWNASKIKPSV